MAASMALVPGRPFTSPRANHQVPTPGPLARRAGGDGFDVQAPYRHRLVAADGAPAAALLSPSEVRLKSTADYVAASVPITVGAAAASLCLLAPLAINPFMGLLVGQLTGSLCLRVVKDTENSSTVRHVAWYSLHALRGVMLGALGAGMLVLPLSSLVLIGAAMVTATLLYTGSRTHLVQPLPEHARRGIIMRQADRLPIIWGLMGVYTLGCGSVMVALCGLALARQAQRLSRHSEATQVAANHADFDPLCRSFPYTGAMYSSFVVASFAGALVATGALL